MYHVTHYIGAVNVQWKKDIVIDVFYLQPSGWKLLYPALNLIVMVLSSPEEKEITMQNSGSNYNLAILIYGGIKEMVMISWAYIPTHKRLVASCPPY